MRSVRPSSALTLLGALVFLVSGAEAQQRRDCTLRPEPGGMIRGDRVPNGCVLTSEDRPPRTTDHLRGATVIVLPDIPLFFTPGETFVVLETGLRTRATGRLRKAGPGATRRLPASRFRERKFGPLLRNFGPLPRNFGRSGSPGSGGRPVGAGTSRDGATGDGD